MKKVILMLSALAFGTVALTACGDYFSSPEKIAFDKFVAHCKAQPDAADCVAWKQNQQGG